MTTRPGSAPSTTATQTSSTQVCANTDTPVADLHGKSLDAPRTRSNFLLFLQFSAKILQNNRLVNTSRELALRSWKSWVRHYTQHFTFTLGSFAMMLAMLFSLKMELLQSWVATPF